MDASASKQRGPGRPAIGRRDPLERDEILDRAMQIVRTDGLEALSMRRLAADLGVTPMALYHHITDKRELIELLIVRVWGEINMNVPFSNDPIEIIVAFCLATRRLWLDNFELASLAVTPFEPDEALYRGTLAYVRLSKAAGFPDVPLAYSAIQNFTMGSIEVVANRRVGSAYFGRNVDDVRERSMALVADSTEDHRGVMEARFDEGDEKHFERGLRALLAGLKLATPAD
jgi:AcrR family transcriptional regulator